MIGREKRVLLRHYHEQGMSKAAIARDLGISRRTVYRWIKTGQLVLCSQSLFRFADLGDDGLCRGGPDKGCGVIVSAIDVVVDRLD